MWSWALLCVATVGSALLFGALHTPTVVATAVLVFVAAALAAKGQTLRGIPMPARVLFALAAYTAFQAVPLPAGLVRALSPHAAEVWQAAFDMTGPGWMSLSIDRGATLVEVLKWTMYGAAFMAAASFGKARNMARGLLLPFASAVVVAIVTLAHGLTRATSVYGLYEPTFGPSIWHIGPLLNPNHLASYLNLGVFCGLGLVVARRRFLPRWALGLAVAFLIPNAVIAGSRGGIVGLCVGVVAFFMLLPRRREADREFGPVPKLALLASVGTVFAVAAGFTVLLASEVTSRELYQTNIDKVRLLTWCGRLVSDYRWFGVGRGAFESAFPAYRSGTNNEIYTHPENLLAQWLGEWGLVVGVAALVALIWLFRPRRLGTRWSVLATGAAAGVAAVFAQNFADFGLEVPAISLAVIVALGVCWGHANSAAGEVSDEGGARSWVVPGAILVVGLVLIGVTLSLGSRPLALERRDFAENYRALDADGGNHAAFRRSTMSAVRAHPGDPYFYRLSALLAWRARQDPMPWLQRALERGPSVGRTHLMVARVLASRQAVRQALMQLRLATTYDPALAPITARAAVNWTADHALLMRAVPEGKAGARTLTAMAREVHGPSLARERLLIEATEREPKDKAAVALLAGDFVRQLELRDESDRCGYERRQECDAAAERWVSKLEQLAPREADPLVMRTRLLRVRGQLDAALAVLAEKCPTLSGRERSQCTKTRLDLAGHSKEGTPFEAASKDYIADKCIDVSDCAGALQKVADMKASRGDWSGALALYDRASREQADDELWIKVARAAARVGAFPRATLALERIRNKSRFEPEYSRLSKTATQGRLEAAPR